MRFFHRRKPSPTHEATEARRRAEDALAHARSQTPIYRAIAESLREVQERNHLAEAFEHALLKGHR